jgi:hypothetical protein
MATRAEIAKRLRDTYPDLPTEQFNIAVSIFTRDAKAYESFKKTKMLPTEAMVKLSGEVVSPGKIAAKAGAAIAGAKAGGKAVTGLAKTVIPKKPDGKVDVKKTVKRAGLLGIAGAVVGALTGEDDADAAAAQQQAIADQANTDLMMGMAQYEAAGGDINALMSTAAGQQLMKNPNFNIGAIMGSQDVMVGGAGVYTGKKEIISSAPPQFAGGRPVEVTSDTISISQWNKQFPMANPKALAEWKAKLVAAGVVSASAGFQELKSQWETWGKLSLEANRQGQKLTPYQLLDIQRGLWGGGGDTGPSYSTQLIKKANSRELLKQYMEAETGRIINDDEANAFADLIRQKQLEKPTKTEVKTVKGKKMTVTTPGFGEAEAAKLAEKQAMQDPRYAEFQTNNVFGTALEKALGLRG